MKRSAMQESSSTALILSPTPPLLYSKSPDIEESHDTKILLVWGDLPYWKVVEQEMYDFIKILENGSTLHDAAKFLANARGHTICSTEARLKKHVQPLVRAGVISSSYSPTRKSETDGNLENITVNITRQCNLSCCFCYNRGIEPSMEEFNIDDLTSFLDKAIPVMGNKKYLTLLGGEPTLRKEKTLVVGKWAAENGFETTISTNGLLIDEDFARKAADYGLKIQVSIDGPTSFEHDSVRGRGTFEKAKKAVSILVKAGVHVVTNMVLHEDNQWRLEDYFKFSRKLGVSGVRFVPLRRIGGGPSLRTPELLKLVRSIRTFFSLKPAYRKLACEDWFTTLASTCRLNRKRATCGAGTSTLLVDADGTVYPCTGQALPEFQLGSIKTPFHRIWKNSRLLAGIRKRYKVENINSLCSKCTYRYWCSAGCRGESYSRTGSCLEPSPSCKENKEVIKEMFWILSETNNFNWENSMPCSGK